MATFFTSTRTSYQITFLSIKYTIFILWMYPYKCKVSSNLSILVFYVYKVQLKYLYIYTSYVLHHDVNIFLRIQINKSLYNDCLVHKEINPESRKAFKNFPELHM